MNKTIILISVALCCCGGISLAKNEKEIDMVASGETHGMLFPCDCPVNPGGGMAKRAHALKAFRDSAAVLLLDAGGFAGGGMYDSYTEGRSHDSVRTILTIKAMAAMHYDAAALGDDDLQYGAKWLARMASENNLPLVSANCEYSDHTPVVSRYILVKKGVTTFAVTGLITQEKLFPIDGSISILPPLASLRKIWPEMKKKSDFQVVLSHLGEEASRMVQDSFPDCAVVVNGHRKTSTEAVVETSGRLFMQFGFEGKSLSFAIAASVNHTLQVKKSGWLSIDADLPDDEAVFKMIQSPGPDTLAGKPAPSKPAVFDLYIMSQCPYGLNALREFMAFAASFPAAEWHLGFIGTLGTDSSLTSLHGSGEVQDEMLWLAVQSLHPQKWPDFLAQRALLPKLSSEATALKMGIPLAPLKQWVKENGRAQLAMHYARSSRLGITASPTLLVNNAPAEMEITKPRLAKTMCGKAHDLSPYCDSVPECIDNSDCRKKGMDGICEQISGKARCQFTNALPFTFTVLLPDSQIAHPEAGVIGTTRDLFEGAAIETVSVASKKGKQLLLDFAPLSLPLYVFDKKASQTVNFSKIEAGLELKKNAYVFKDGYVKSSYFFKRPLVPGACEVFIDPLFSGVKDALAIALAKRKNVRVHIEPIIFIHPDSSKLSGEDQLRRDEAERWLLLLEKYDAEYGAYLAAYLRKNAASYWFLTMRDLGVNVDDFVKNIKSDPKRLIRHWTLLGELGIAGPVEVLINNREVVPVKSPKDLGDILERIK
jgi:5''-nucleotidase/2'',3''-cyclic phosphodiesterase and related esterases